MGIQAAPEVAGGGGGRRTGGRAPREHALPCPGPGARKALHLHPHPFWATTLPSPQDPSVPFSTVTDQHCSSHLGSLPEGGVPRAGVQEREGQSREGLRLRECLMTGCATSVSCRLRIPAEILQGSLGGGLGGGAGSDPVTSLSFSTGTPPPRCGNVSSSFLGLVRFPRRLPPSDLKVTARPAASWGPMDGDHRGSLYLDGHSFLVQSSWHPLAQRPTHLAKDKAPVC